MIKNQLFKAVASISGELLLLAVLGWFSVGRERPATVSGPSSTSALVAENGSFDFGEVEMKRGVVSTTFVIRNSGDKPLEITKVYTSCMCTEASLILPGRQPLGPFGMPGHGFIPTLNAVLGVGEEAQVKAFFDPAAHGPAGIGRVSRTIYLENNAGAPLTLNFTANVVP